MKRIIKIVLISISVIIISLIGLLILSEEIKTFQQPDLIPENLQVINMNATSVSFSWKLKNIGDETIPLIHSEKQHEDYSNINLYVYVSKDTIIKNTNDSLRMMLRANNNNHIELAPKQSLEGLCVMSIPNESFQWKYLMMQIDPNNEIDESNEDNNIAYISLSQSEIERIWGNSKEEIAKIECAEAAFEDISLDTISFDQFLRLFDKEFPQKYTFSSISDSLANLYLDCPEIDDKVVLFDNGETLPRLYGFAYALKQINEDIFWLTYRSQVGENGASVEFILSVINRKENRISNTFTLATAFGEDGYFNKKSGEFINDSTYKYKRIWNDEDYKTDSIIDAFVINGK